MSPPLAESRHPREQTRVPRAFLPTSLNLLCGSALVVVRSTLVLHRACRPAPVPLAGSQRLPRSIEKSRSGSVRFGWGVHRPRTERCTAWGFRCRVLFLRSFSLVFLFSWAPLVPVYSGRVYDVAPPDLFLSEFYRPGDRTRLVQWWQAGSALVLCSAMRALSGCYSQGSETAIGGERDF